MKLRGQGHRNRSGERGYAMVTLLIGMSIAAIMMSRVMPVWKQMSMREKEAELVFRGQQYARAIGLYQRRAGPGVLPPSIDLLVDQKFLRKKYKDPITGDDFDLLRQGQALPGQEQGQSQSQGQGQGRGQAQGRGPGAGLSPAPGTTSSITGGPIGGVTGPIIGVVSKSKEKSIRLYNGRNYYNEWQFVFQELQRGPSTPEGGAQTPGGPVLPGGRGPGGRGGRDGGSVDNPFGRGRGNTPQTPFGGRSSGPNRPDR
jgi:type II secretory pathway pseudopilin PulG